MSEALLESLEARDVDRLAKLLTAGADAYALLKSTYGYPSNPLYAPIGA